MPDAYKGAVVAIGNFDGVHRGHQALIGEARSAGAGAQRAARRARLRAASAGILPARRRNRFRLTPFRTKARLIAEQGADVMFALAFDARDGGARPRRNSCIDVLVRALGVGCVVVGADFQFGKGRAGNATVLSYMGEMEGFGVTVFEPVRGRRITRRSPPRSIREALKAGRPEEAARLLGHCWSDRGARRAWRQARPHDRISRPPTCGSTNACKPAFGIYAVRATVLEDDKPVRTP